LRDILKNDDAEIAAIVAVINHIDPDILLLTDFDFDAGGAAMAAFSDLLAHPFEDQFALRPNAGVWTGLDVDGDGYTGDARDAMGYGRFFGDGGMALLSRFPIHETDVIDLTGLLWRDIPDAVMPFVDGAQFPSVDVHDMIRVSSTGHWIVPVDLGTDTISLMAFSATAPVFDGPEDFNGLRNRDEIRVWDAVLNGAFGPPPINPIIVGNVNADPSDGEGYRDTISNLLAHPDLRDPRPEGKGGLHFADAGQIGNPALDTADWSDDGPGNLRVSYILPSRDLTVIDAGVFWPAPDDPLAALLGDDGLAAGPHRLVWVDIAVQGLP